MDVQGKVWGLTQLIMANGNFEVHRIEGKKGKRCSKHRHLHKHNLFFVESGQIAVRVWKNDYNLVDVTTLGPKEQTVVKPGEYHRFEVLEDCVAYEIYWVELDGSDIEREDHGGETKEDV